VILVRILIKLVYRLIRGFSGFYRTKDKNDQDIIREHHRFVWDEDEDNADTWEKQLSKRYYDKLFKEYCICDLSLYKSGKVCIFMML
jgi:hypothetical protein